MDLDKPKPCPMPSPDAASTFGLVILTLVLAGIDIIVIAGNSMIIAAAKTSPRLRNNLTVTFIVSLALTDLCLGVFVLPFSIVHQVLMKHWIFGKAVCFIWHALDVWLFTASMLHLVFIGYERYLAIIHPMKYADVMTMKKVHSFIFIAWCLGFLICLPKLLKSFQPSHDYYSEGFGLFKPLDRTETNASLLKNTTTTKCYKDSDYQCTISTSSPSFIVFSALSSFYIPSFIVGYFNLRIFRMYQYYFKMEKVAKAQDEANASNAKSDDKVLYVKEFNNINEFNCSAADQQIQSQVTFAENTERDGLIDNETGQISPAYIEAVSRSRSGSLDLSHMAAEYKACRLLGIISVTFICCVLPFYLVYLSRAFCYNCIKQSDVVFEILFWLGYISSAINPFYYVFLSREFNKQVRKLLGLDSLDVTQSDIELLGNH